MDSGYINRDVVFAIGGYNGQEVVGETEVLDLTGGSHLWEAAEPMLKRRRGFGMALLETRIFVVGGESDGCLDSLEIFDLASQWWMQGPRMPTRRYDLAAVAHEGRLFAIGGRGDGKLSGAVESFDPTAHAWESHALLLKPRAGLGAAALGPSVFAIGGDIGTRRIQASSRNERLFDGCWEGAPPMSLERCDPGVTAYDSKIFVIGGYGGRHGAAGVTPTIEIFDTQSQTWSAGPDMSYSRSGLSATLLAGPHPNGGAHRAEIYVVGGAFAGVGSTTTEVLDVTRMEWREGPALGTRRWGVRVASFSGETVRLEGERRDKRRRARYALAEAIAVRDAIKLRAAIEEGRNVDLDDSELLIPLAMLDQQAKKGFMVGFDVPSDLPAARRRSV